MRAVIADDSVLLREGIARILADGGFEVVGQAGTADELLLKVRSYEPDVAVVDIRMPPTQTDEGLQAAKQIRSAHPGTGVLVLSQHIQTAYALELLEGNAAGVGYLLKDRVSDVKEFTAAVRRVADGGTALDPEVVSRLVGRHRSADPLDDLTPREREVMQLMAEGRSNRGVAEQLVVTERAVEKHITSIFGKLRLEATGEDHRRVLAVLKYLES
jgi:DNA-binding NarL/FixJ family response regulator